MTNGRRALLHLEHPGADQVCPVSPGSGKIINYLYTSSTNLDLSRYKGLHIVVTGEEGLDERWKNHPVITIQRIQVLE